MRIEAEKLTPQGEPFTHTYAEGDLSLEDEGASLTGETAVEGRAARKGEEVRLTGRIRAAVEAACDRCVSPLALPLEIEFTESFTPHPLGAGAGEEKELQPADLHLSFYEGEEIDVDELVREQVLLALPAQLVCRDDCKGLCQNCGANLNEGNCQCPQGEIDPRWSALADFKRDVNRE